MSIKLSENKFHAEFEGLMAVKMSTVVFWVVGSHVNGYYILEELQ
jgi:hypothetical protein